MGASVPIKFRTRRCVGMVYQSMADMRESIASLSDDVVMTYYDYLSNKPGHGDYIDEDWNGFRSKRELASLMDNGVQDARMLQRAQSVRAEGRATEICRKYIACPDGDDFSLDRFVAGSPDFMGRNVYVRGSKKPLSIVLEGGIASTVDMDDCLFAGLTLTRIVTALERAGYPCTIYIGDGSLHGAELCAYATCIRKAGQTFNPGQVLFATHPACVRGVSFSWCARIRPHWGNQGRPLDSEMSHGEELELFKQLLPSAKNLTLLRTNDIIKRARGNLADEVSEELAREIIGGIINGR